MIVLFHVVAKHKAKNAIQWIAVQVLKSITMEVGHLALFLVVKAQKPELNIEFRLTMVNLVHLRQNQHLAQNLVVVAVEAAAVMAVVPHQMMDTTWEEFIIQALIHHHAQAQVARRF